MPTQLISKYLTEFARWVRNDSSYDDWEYGTEVIPGDKTWVKKCKQCNKCTCRMDDKKEEK